MGLVQTSILAVDMRGYLMVRMRCGFTSFEVETSKLVSDETIDNIRYWEIIGMFFQHTPTSKTLLTIFNPLNSFGYLR